jgi:hypothetical protein
MYCRISLIVASNITDARNAINSIMPDITDMQMQLTQYAMT